MELAVHSLNSYQWNVSSHFSFSNQVQREDRQEARINEERKQQTDESGQRCRGKTDWATVRKGSPSHSGLHIRISTGMYDRPRNQTATLQLPNSQNRHIFAKLMILAEFLHIPYNFMENLYPSCAKSRLSFSTWNTHRRTDLCPLSNWHMIINFGERVSRRMGYIILLIFSWVPWCAQRVTLLDNRQTLKPLPSLVTPPSGSATVTSSKYVALHWLVPLPAWFSWSLRYQRSWDIFLHFFKFFILYWISWPIRLC